MVWFECNDTFGYSGLINLNHIQKIVAEDSEHSFKIKAWHVSGDMLLVGIFNTKKERDKVFNEIKMMLHPVALNE